MALDPQAFDQVKLTDQQTRVISILRDAVKTYAAVLDAYLPDNPDKTYLLRKLREVAMWANVCITKHSDGAPRL